MFVSCAKSATLLEGYEGTKNKVLTSNMAVRPCGKKQSFVDNSFKILEISKTVLMSKAKVYNENKKYNFFSKKIFKYFLSLFK